MTVNSTLIRNHHSWEFRLFNAFKQNIKNSTYDNYQMAQELEMSERQLFRKIKALTGVSPQRYLRHFRLQQAMNYLKNGKYQTVNETAYAVGFINVSYFISQFEKQYGCKPLAVLRENGWR